MCLRRGKILPGRITRSQDEASLYQPAARHRVPRGRNAAGSIFFILFFFIFFISLPRLCLNGKDEMEGCQNTTREWHLWRVSSAMLRAVR